MFDKLKLPSEIGYPSDKIPALNKEYQVQMIIKLNQNLNA